MTEDLPARLRSNAIGYTSVGVHDTAGLLNEAAERIEVLEAALRALLACEYESASHGLLDCIDNDGAHYQSAHLAKCIAEAETLLTPESSQ